MRVRVWDLFVRLFHWSVAGAFFTNYWLIEDGPAHRILGYGVAGLLVLRILWGIFGSPYARFSNFFPTPTRLTTYWDSVRAGRHPAYCGHNPVGALMILALLGGLTILCLTGWMMGLDQFWGEEWVEEAHEITAVVIHLLVAIHVTAVVINDLVFDEGLFHAMISGNKRMPDCDQAGEEPVTHH
jgi:cytochrome b